MLGNLFYQFGRSISKIELEISTIEEQIVYIASYNVFVQFAYFSLSIFKADTRPNEFLRLFKLHTPDVDGCLKLMTKLGVID